MSEKMKYSPKPILVPQSGRRVDVVPDRLGGLSLTSVKARLHLVERLKKMGIKSTAVLDALQVVPRHLFVDEAFASRAYEDAALPIGYKQTISRPYTVAKFLEYALEKGLPIHRVLEVGTGCGYQAAVLSLLAKQVVSIERIRALYEKAKKNLQDAGYHAVTVRHDDGLKGYAGCAPYDVIVVAAAGLNVADSLLKQLTIGGRLIAPVTHETRQVLVTIDRISDNQWKRKSRDTVNFVPLVEGTKEV